MLVLIVNSGGSSLKLALYHLPSSSSTARNTPPEWSTLRPLCTRSVDVAPDLKIEEQVKQLMDHYSGTLSQQESNQPLCIDYTLHRVVQSGHRYDTPVIVDDVVYQCMCDLVDLDELHMPAALRGIDQLRQTKLSKHQIVCFDTTFYRSSLLMKQHSSHAYALPKQWRESYHVQRFGFHGMAHQSMMQIVAYERLKVDAAAPINCGRLITLQLGSGCSITAIKDGQPIDTSMGYTPLEGLMMSTRCGDIDPGLLLYLFKKTKLEPAEMEKKLYFESGLLGLCGSKDMKDIVGNKDENCKAALQAFVQRCTKYIGAYTALLGGVDTIIFGGGISEHSKEVRKMIIESLSFLHIKIDNETNDTVKGNACIARNKEGLQVWICKVDEGSVMIQNAYENKLFQN